MIACIWASWWDPSQSAEAKRLSGSTNMTIVAQTPVQDRTLDLEFVITSGKSGNELQQTGSV
jgi:hypothetical protein